MKLEVTYSIEKDAQTYHGRVNIQETLLEKLDIPLQSLLKSVENDQEAFCKIRSYLEQTYNSNPTIIKDSAAKLKTMWGKVGDNIIFSLEFLYKKPFPFKFATAYLTTNFIFPYNYEQKYFFVNFKYLSTQLNTIKHELNHFMFYYYYPAGKDLNLEVRTLGKMIPENVAIHFNDEEYFLKKMDATSFQYLFQGLKETGAANLVSAIILDYRALDTLGEATILFTAVIGVLAVIRKIGRKK